MLDKKRSLRPVAIWLLVGVAMIIIQVLLGGITRLTGSGLSITRWDLVTGSLPPMNDAEWENAFDGYKQTAQFKTINSSFTVSDFKYIYFWEWLHRVWARFISVVFIIPFIIFIIQKRFQKWMVNPLLVLFGLGAVQGLVGWIMVATGLHGSNLLYVRHYELATHFMLALLVLCYTLWFALKMLVKQENIIVSKPLYKLSVSIITLLTVQLIYGAFMAGLKAGMFAPTWPEINNAIIPSGDILFKKSPSIINIFENEIMIQFIHRGLAYILFILVCIWTYRAYKISQPSPLFNKTKWLPITLVSLQVILGVFTVLHSGLKQELLWLGVSHQFTAMMFLMVMVWEIYLVRRNKG